VFLVEDVHLWLELWMFILNCAFLTFILDLRAQGDYLGRGGGGRAGTAQEYVANPRAMPGGNYGPSRVESELVAQYGGGRSGAGGAGGASAYAGGQQASVYGGIGGGRGLAGQIYGGQPAMGYGGVQLPPGRDYGAGRGAGGGFSAQRDGYARSDRPSIGSSRNDDRREQRPVFHVGDRHYDDNSRRRDPRERGRSNSSRVGVGSGRGGGLGGTGGAGGFEREERDRVRDRDRERREDDRKRDRSPGLRASHDRKMSPAGDREDRGRKESPRREPSYR
jgi:hypothetical protein